MYVSKSLFLHIFKNSKLLCKLKYKISNFKYSLTRFSILYKNFKYENKFSLYEQERNCNVSNYFIT